jgi:hypothetical protein
MHYMLPQLISKCLASGFWCSFGCYVTTRHIQRDQEKCYRLFWLRTTDQRSRADAEVTTLLLSAPSYTGGRTGLGPGPHFTEGPQIWLGEITEKFKCLKNIYEVSDMEKTQLRQLNVRYQFSFPVVPCAGKRVARPLSIVMPYTVVL